MVMAATGCGSSGSSPPLYAEVRFEVRATSGGQALFAVEELAAGGVRHTFPPDTIFTTTTVQFRFLFENAPLPYSGTFRQIGDATIEVHLIQEGTGIETTVMTSGDATRCPPPPATPDAACLVTPHILGPPLAIKIPNPEVRFDVCSPLPGRITCAAASLDAGNAEVQFVGTIGDPFVTYLIGQSLISNPPVFTPAIFFFDGAQDNVAAQFAGVRDAVLTAQLFIDCGVGATHCAPVDSATGSGQIDLKEDL
jgi:hypothetical protein